MKENDSIILRGFVAWCEKKCISWDSLIHNEPWLDCGQIRISRYGLIAETRCYRFLCVLSASAVHCQREVSAAIIIREP